MLLSVTILCLCILLNTIQDIIKRFKISQYFVRNNNEKSNRELLEELRIAEEELKHVKENPTKSGEYAHTIKVMRAEEKVKNIQGKIRGQKDWGRLRNASTEMFAIYGAKALISFIMFIITVRNRYEPVMIFSKDYFNFQPLTALLSLPTGVPNAISVPIWILSCNLTCRHVISLLKRQPNANPPKLSS